MSSQPIFEFDAQDRELFGVGDLRLRADALKHSVLPRLQALMSVGVAMVRDIYGVEAFDDSIVSLSPNFRMKREREIKVDYQLASACLGGKRKLGMWSGLARNDGKPVQIMPYLYGFDLSAEGLRLCLFSGFAKGLTVEARLGLVDRLAAHAPLVADLCRWGNVELLTPEVSGATHIMSFAERIALYRRHDDVDWMFLGKVDGYPVDADVIGEMAWRFALLYPLYDLCVRYSKGEADRFDAMIEKTNAWLASSAMEAGAIDSDGAEATQQESHRNDGDVLKHAEDRVKVMPGLRWQVFQRDNWRCVACGRLSHDGVLLQVDHVLPRSKGGKDMLDNLQTLCSECNVGKGNRDSTCLRI